MSVVHLLRISLESPTLIVARSGRGGYSSLDWIPGTVLRGALITGAVRYGYVGEEYASREITDPSCVVHPAYPVHRNLGHEEVCKPATPFVYKCKEGELIDVLGRDKIEELSKVSSKDELLEMIPKNVDLKCPLMRGVPGSTKPAQGSLVFHSGGKLRSHEVEVEVLTSVGINKRLRAHETGMLFNYEVLVPGQEFITLAIYPEEVARFVKEVGEIWIGRGTSRGLGRAKVDVVKETSVQEIVPELQDRAMEEIAKVGDECRFVLYARSLVTRLKGPWISSPIPGDPEGWEVSPEVVMDGGEPLVLGRTAVFSSFSNSTGIPRPQLMCSERGSVFLMRAKGSEDKVAEALARAAVLGWDGLSHLGLNILLPLGWWYDDPLYR